LHPQDNSKNFCILRHNHSAHAGHTQCANKMGREVQDETPMLSASFVAGGQGRSIKRPTFFAPGRYAQAMKRQSEIYKQVILTIIILFTSNYLIGQTKDSSSYLGINLAPVFMTQIDLTYEKTFNSSMTGLLSGGFVINAPYGSLHKIGTDKDLTKRSGGFIRIGVKGHLKDKTISPFVGGLIINSVSIEEGVAVCPDSLFCTQNIPNFSKTSYNIGVAGIIGLTLKPLKRIKIDIGIQAGVLLIDRLADYHSFTPGMGINWNPMKTQFIMEVKYKLKK